jgi:uncharacterized protein DUF5615
LRLLLDEHFSKVIARQLRADGRDVVAVTERDDLRGISDEALLVAEVAERRAVVTRSVADFVTLDREAALIGRQHYGLVYTSTRAFPPSKAAVGDLVRALRVLLEAHPGDEALLNRTHWLTEV